MLIYISTTHHIYTQAHTHTHIYIFIYSQTKNYMNKKVHDLTPFLRCCQCTYLNIYLFRLVVLLATHKSIRELTSYGGYINHRIVYMDNVWRRVHGNKKYTTLLFYLYIFN